MTKDQKKAQIAQEREENKMIDQHEESVAHRWISLTEKRGDQTCIPFKFKVNSFMMMDQN